jgi:hypothetical protein
VGIEGEGLGWHVKWGKLCRIVIHFSGKKISAVLKAHYAYSFNACPRYQTNTGCFGGVTFSLLHAQRVGRLNCPELQHLSETVQIKRKNKPKKKKKSNTIYLFIYDRAL